MLKASRDLQNHEGLEDEVRGEDEIDDRSKYEHNNDAKDMPSLSSWTCFGKIYINHIQ